MNFTDPSGLNMAGPDTRYGECPPGSARCGSGEGMGARPLLDGFNTISWWNGEAWDYRTLHQPYFAGRAGGSGEEFGGGAQNPTQPMLGPCNLTTPGFDDLAGHPALGLLSGPFDDDPRAFYNSLGTYNQAVLLNTAAALADAGVNLGNANFIGFYRSEKSGNAAYGIEVTGVGKGDLGTIGPSRIFGYRSPGSVKIGSGEATFKKGYVAFDVDLYNPKSNFRKHQEEVGYNKRNNTPTHAGDVARQLAARGLNSGVRCQ